MKRETLKDVEAAWELVSYLENLTIEKYDRDFEYVKQNLDIGIVKDNLRQTESHARAMPIDRFYLDRFMERMAEIERKVFEYKALQPTH